VGLGPLFFVFVLRLCVSRDFPWNNDLRRAEACETTDRQGTGGQTTDRKTTTDE
jgi:hypothetical protein